MIKAGIIGGAGYTGGELIRILIRHESIQHLTVQSESHRGDKVSKAHPDLFGETELVFSDIDLEETDIIFLCSGHGASEKWMKNNKLPEKLRIIDLSSDFRISDEHKHSFVYGLPELDRFAVREAQYVANPGCFATAIQLALLPAVQAGISTTDFNVSAITGSTGAGQQPSATTHYSWRSNNASVYKGLEHQHLAEILQSLQAVQPSLTSEVYFVPFRGAFTRGIIAAAHFGSKMEIEDIKKVYRHYYEEHPFVHISEEEVDIKQVVNTNKALIYLKKTGKQVLITCVIDNLLKGASGQAVQNMNLMFSIKETTGLHMKGSAF